MANKLLLKKFETYNDLVGERDIFVFSTDSEGTYRWSKVIGGGSEDFASSLVVGDQNGIYVSGTTYDFNDNTPVHFGTDTIMAEGADDPGLNNKKAFLIKYNSQGVFQWLRQPEGEEVPLDLSGGFVKTVVEPNGHTRSLVWFGVGTHLTGN